MPPPGALITHTSRLARTGTGDFCSSLAGYSPELLDKMPPSISIMATFSPVTVSSLFSLVLHACESMTITEAVNPLTSDARGHLLRLLAQHLPRSTATTRCGCLLKMASEHGDNKEALPTPTPVNIRRSLRQLQQLGSVSFLLSKPTSLPTQPLSLSLSWLFPYNQPRLSR